MHYIFHSNVQFSSNQIGANALLFVRNVMMLSFWLPSYFISLKFTAIGGLFVDYFLFILRYYLHILTHSYAFLRHFMHNVWKSQRSHFLSNKAKRRKKTMICCENFHNFVQSETELKWKKRNLLQIGTNAQDELKINMKNLLRIKCLSYNEAMHSFTERERSVQDEQKMWARKRETEWHKKGDENKGK